MVCEATRHHGVDRYQSITTLGVATESTGESFIYLETSWSDVDQSFYSSVSIEIPLSSRRRGLRLRVVLGFRTTGWNSNIFAHPSIQISQFATIRTKRHMGSRHFSRKRTATSWTFR
jgi:hypothetical protein